MPADTVKNFALGADELRNRCGSLPHVSEADTGSRERAPAEVRHLGQKRAVDALLFGCQIRKPGYNVFVLGTAGADRHGLAEEFARDQAANLPAPDDWCYVHNFANPERPRTLRFTAGAGKAFRNDMEALIDELRLAIPAAFESEDYRNQLKALETETQQEVQGYWKELENRAAQENIGVLQTPTGFVLAPMRDGRVLSDEEFEKLPDADREAAQAAIRRLSEDLERHIEKVPQMQKRFRQQLKELNRSVTEHSVGILIADLKTTYKEQSAVVAYLDAVEENIIDNAQDFREQQQPSLPFISRDSQRLFNQYEVNLLVSNRPDASAPVVYEPNPSYQNVIGKVEYRAELGALLTDFRMVRGGALHRANGGYLVLDAHRVLTRPFIWEGLKQALTARRIRIESPGESYGLISTATLQPEPIPLDVKIILVGERRLYYLLAAYDSEFLNLFKVAADLDDELVRSDKNVEAYTQLIATRIDKNELMRFDQTAVAAVIEERSRVAEDSERLSMNMRSLDDLLTQADHWARLREAECVESDDVKKAMDESRHRLSRVQSKIADAIARDTLLIDTTGTCVGQVNGLSVTELGELSFGHPVRITATTRLGTGDVVDIEREVELGGAIHSKGVMILSAALAARYAHDVPFSLQACIVFEQTYGGVEGDSASVAEYCALLSSLSGIGIRQNIAVTGSVNQLGRVQVVGGVNEKIEGFFDTCKERGLDGTQGVVVPRDNVKHLMLRPDVVSAVDEGQFHVYAVRTVDEALSILTGEDAGDRDASGNFPERSVNWQVEQKLRHYADIRSKSLGSEEGHDDE